jgi:hypothetical protein
MRHIFHLYFNVTRIAPTPTGPVTSSTQEMPVFTGEMTCSTALVTSAMTAAAADMAPGYYKQNWKLQ